MRWSNELTGCLCISWWRNTRVSELWPRHKKQFVQDSSQIGPLSRLSPDYLQPEQTGVKELTLPTISVNPRAQIRGRPSVKPSLPSLPVLPTATAALWLSGTAPLSLFRVPRTDTASTWDMPKRLSIRALLLLLLLSWRRYKCSAAFARRSSWLGTNRLVFNYKFERAVGLKHWLARVFYS